jgi:CheY-like chemotaxis protein
MLQIIIQDTGCGIPDSMKPRLFQPFSMSDESNSRKYGGSGLGLYITKMLLDSMNGTINISSQVKKGTIVSVTVPFMPYSDVSSAHGSVTSGTIYFSKNLCILVAEDNKINQTIVKKILEGQAIQVRIANNGQEAIQLIDVDLNGEISMVLMDIQMPILDGIEAFHYIHSKKPNMPVVAMTANALESDRKYHLEIGMVDHISKPFTAKELLRVIAKCVPKS